MITEKQIRSLVEEKLLGGDNFIVEVSVKPGNRINVLIDNDKGIVIKDCVQVSRHIESNLDRETEDFELQVSSPGLGEPLQVFRQYLKCIGSQVEVVTVEGKKIVGKLISAEQEGLVIEEKYKERVEANKPKQLIINNTHLTFDKIKETKAVVSFK